MSAPTAPSSAHRVWRAAYRALLVLLPHELRARHGETMVDLYARELSRRAPEGASATVVAALAGLGDLLGRGLVERVAQERRHFGVTERHVLWQSVKGFALAFFVLTIAMLVWTTSREYRTFTDEQLPNLLWYSVPFTALVTIPMAVLVAVLFGLNGQERKESSLASSRLTALYATTILVSMFSMLVSTEIVPRSNFLLQYEMSVDKARSELYRHRGDRSMTLFELVSHSRHLSAEMDRHRAHLRTRPSSSLDESDPIAQHVNGLIEGTSRELSAARVEIHKKFAIPAACFVFAFFAVALTRRLRRIGMAWQMVVSLAVFTGYYMLLMAGETLADNGRLAPSLAMWGANIALLLIAWALGHRTSDMKPSAASAVS